LELRIACASAVVAGDVQSRPTFREYRIDIRALIVVDGQGLPIAAI
jgi:hypothetical protein